jgi:hypothetical protein
MGRLKGNRAKLYMMMIMMMMKLDDKVQVNSTV